MKTTIFGLIFILLISYLIWCDSESPNTPEPTMEEVVILSHAQKIEQLIGDFDRERQTPTSNLTGQRYGLYFTDLGVPFKHKDRIYLLFGDAVPGADDPIAYTTDNTPENGINLNFLQNDVGTYRPVSIPGISLKDFEVPMEGVSVNDKMYIYATTGHTADVTMGRSVVAVSEDDGYNFTHLYDFSSLYFINVSIVKTDVAVWQGFPDSAGTGLVILGSGEYRASDVRLAYQPADSIELRTSIYFLKGLNNANKPLWSKNEAEAAPIFYDPVVGELSVSYNTFLKKWILLYNDNKGIAFRYADYPWGPWSEAKLIFDPWEDNGYGHFIHVSWQHENVDSVHDPGRENEWGGAYGPYQFEDLATGDSTSTTIYFTMSTWNPYTVVLMKAILGLKKIPDY
ncbi:MAG: DUF4185 domain-containing protein [Calditrichaeota bacterium]|nr:DUF4185 domain-containing protein [Calditrichota bacterium]